LDLDRATVIAGLKIKAIRDAVREMARHDMNDSGWIFFRSNVSK
jgi:hypothetical protein